MKKMLSSLTKSQLTATVYKHSSTSCCNQCCNWLLPQFSYEGWLARSHSGAITFQKETFQIARVSSAADDFHGRWFFFLSCLEHVWCVMRTKDTDEIPSSLLKRSQMVIKATLTICSLRGNCSAEKKPSLAHHFLSRHSPNSHHWLNLCTWTHTQQHTHKLPIRQCLLTSNAAVSALQPVL